MNIGTNKKILMIVSADNFRDEEYQEPREIFEKAGATVTVACSSKKISVGMFGMKITPDLLINDVKVEAYDAIVFVGGTGSVEYFGNKKALEIACESVKLNKILAAICLAPGILARAGVLKGKRATVYSSEMENLRESGAIYSDSSVERDGKIVTANGPSAALKFAETILNVMAMGN
ncbi:MAG: DJ-1/PfpI family protein [Oligoflexia bacterium]|nr:DJ-1/PfpI family protein [Oligoflexia bacterium]